MSWHSGPIIGCSKVLSPTVGSNRRKIGFKKKAETRLIQIVAGLLFKSPDNLLTFIVIAKKSECGILHISSPNYQQYEADRQTQQDPSDLSLFSSMYRIPGRK